MYCELSAALAILFPLQSKIERLLRSISGAESVARLELWSIILSFLRGACAC
jgi:hypothetical protein